MFCVLNVNVVFYVVHQQPTLEVIAIQTKKKNSK